MKFLGIDYGGKEIGIAVSDDGGSFAFPHGILQNDATLIRRVSDLCRELQIDEIILGDTRTLNGSENTITQESDEFAVALERATQRPVVRSWEAWSTFEAARFAPENDKHNDAAAAAIILQRYLDART